MLGLSLNAFMKFRIPVKGSKYIQSWTNYLRQFLVSIWNRIGHYENRSISIFLELFACIDKLFTLQGKRTLGYDSMKIWNSPDIS